MKRIFSTIFIFILGISSCEEMKVYEIKKIPTGQLTINGKGDHPLWQQANVLTDFIYPWRKESPPPTVFRALWDEDHLFFLYDAFDPDIITKLENNDEKDVVQSDRVEIFFKADDNMDPYYALELDSRGRILDTKGRFYRNIDYNWNWPEGHLVVKASTYEEGYRVEASITLESLRQLGMLQSDTIHAGLYRGEYIPIDANDRNATRVKWISWVKPMSKKPDFHIPSSFGILKLMD